jgi:hypothetical protein
MQNYLFSDHIDEKVNKAYSIAGIMKRNFSHMSKEAFILYKSMIRSHLEYATSVSVWPPYKLGDMEIEV